MRLNSGIKEEEQGQKLVVEFTNIGLKGKEN